MELFQTRTAVGQYSSTTAVRDHRQTAQLLPDGQVVVSSYVGRRRAGRYVFALTDYLRAAEACPGNPRYGYRAFLASCTGAEFWEATGGVGQAARILDAQLAAVEQSRQPTTPGGGYFCY